jgi:hypothetical protein
MAREGAKSLIDVGANALKKSLGGKVKRGGYSPYGYNIGATVGARLQE